MEGRVAFRGSDNRLYTVRPDGTDQRPLTSARSAYRYNGRTPLVRESWPAWSPDGARVAYSQVLPELDGSLRLEVRVADVQSGESTSVFVNPHGSSTIGGRVPHYLQWSSDGAHLAFIAATPQGMGLYVAPNAANAREVTRQAPLYLAWAPDRPGLLVHARERHLLIDPSRPGVSLDVEAVSVVHRLSSWAPDGSGMAYIWDRPGSRLALHLADRLGRNPREVTPVRAFAGFLWSPAGDAIAVGDDQDPSMPYYARMRVVRLDGSQREVPLERVLAFFWSPDGSRLACLTLGASEGTVALVVMETGAASLREAARVELTPSWGLLALLPFYDQYALSHRIWAPDSRYLTLSGYIANAGQSAPRGEDDTHVYVIDAEGRDAPKTVGQGVMAFWSPK